MDLTSESGTCDPLCSVDETSPQDFEGSYLPKTDLLKAVAVFAAAATGTVAINHSWVAANQDLAMALLFVIGYAGIIFVIVSIFIYSFLVSMSLIILLCI